MTSTLKFVDAAFASSITGGPYDGVCFYIGGDAFHVWSITDIDGREEQYKLPIWVRSDPVSVSSTADAADCLSVLAAYRIPKGVLVALDSETAIDASWTKEFVDAINKGGYKVIDYGTQSDVFGNQNPDGYYWGADWTSQPHLHSGDQMTQYVSFNNEDVSAAESTLPFWNTKQATKGSTDMHVTSIPENWRGKVIVVFEGEDGHTYVTTSQDSVTWAPLSKVL